MRSRCGGCLARCGRSLTWLPDAEVTLECAPGQLGEETLDEMLRLGMNRVSFGVQSFVDAEARAVGQAAYAGDVLWGRLRGCGRPGCRTSTSI